MKTRPMTLVNLILATILLTSIFLVNAIPSSSVGEYDPWEDLNEDGAINIFDLVQLSGDYATTGDPAKNVSVTNLPLDENGDLRIVTKPQSKLVTMCANLSFSLPLTMQTLGSCDIAGWRYVTIWASWQCTAPSEVILWGRVESIRLSYGSINLTVGGSPYYVTLEQPIPVPTLDFTIQSTSDGQVDIAGIYVYLTNIT